MSSEIERPKYNPTMSVSPPFYIDLSGSLRSMKIPPAASAYSSPRKSKGCGRMCCKGGIGKTAAEYSEARWGSSIDWKTFHWMSNISC